MKDYDGESCWTTWSQLPLDNIGMTILLTVFLATVLGSVASSGNETRVNCKDLQPGQYYCEDPAIDRDTQQAVNCTKEQLVKVPCHPVEGLECDGEFTQQVPCKWTNGKRFDVALLLSVFLGWLGIDRFYLGYPALGLVKLCTFGFLLLWHLVDILLIAIQVVGPSDGSAYVMDYYGAGLIRVDRDNMTYVQPPKYDSYG